MYSTWVDRKIVEGGGSVLCNYFVETNPILLGLNNQVRANGCHSVKAIQAEILAATMHKGGELREPSSSFLHAPKLLVDDCPLQGQPPGLQLLVLS